MADTRPTRQSFIRCMYLCYLVIVNPSKFIKEEERDTEVRNDFPPAGESEHRIYIVRRALWHSLGLILLSCLVGVLVGLFLCHNFSQPSSYCISFLQVLGACLLLWGTLFIRGWEIQTFCGVTLTERVNQWIYRILYCLGTSIIICSLIWAIE